MTAVVAILGGSGVVGGGGGLSAVAAPDAVSGSGSGSQVSGISTCSASGGTAPYSYAWEFVAGDAVGIQTPTTAATRFTASAPSAEVFAASFRCVVTDATLATTASNIVSATLTGL